MPAKAATETTSSAMPAATQVQRRWASTLSDPATSEFSAAAAPVKSPTTAITAAAGITARDHPGLLGRLARLSITGAVPSWSASVDSRTTGATITTYLPIPEILDAQAYWLAPRGPAGSVSDQASIFVTRSSEVGRTEAEVADHGIGALRRLRARGGADARAGSHGGVARVRDRVGGRLAAGRAVTRRGDPGRDEHHHGGDRHRQRLAGRGRRGRPLVSPHRGRSPRPVPARRGRRSSRGHRRVPLALPDAGGLPRRARRRGRAVRAADPGGAWAAGAAAGRDAHGRRASLPGHAGALAPGPRDSRRGQAPRARAARCPGS